MGGFGTIVGSAGFNVLFVIGCCAIFTPGHLPLTWWPFARDCTYYVISLSILAIFYGVISPDIIEWYEALILLLMYCGYAIIMFNNKKIQKYVFSKLYSMKKTKDDTPISSDLHFHASFYDLITKDASVKDLMGVHIVTQIKGETKQTFDAIDVDGNGFIDHNELGKVLYNLGETVSDLDIKECFDEIDT